MKSFKQLVDEIAANAVASGGVDLTPHIKPKKDDRRKKYAIEKMYKRSKGK